MTSTLLAWIHGLDGDQMRWHRRPSRQSQEEAYGVTPAGFFSEWIKPLCTENSNPDVLMVKPAEDRV